MILKFAWSLDTIVHKLLLVFFHVFIFYICFRVFLYADLLTWRSELYLEDGTLKLQNKVQWVIIISFQSA